MADAVTLSFTWIPEPQIMANQFYTWAGELEDFTIPLTDSVPTIAKDVEARFASEGPGWAPWSESYAESEQHGESILTRTGALRGHATSPDSYVVLPTMVYYQALSQVDVFHQAGTSKMPARPFMGLSRGGEEVVMGIFARWLDGIFGAERLMPGESLVTAGSRVSIRGAGGRFVG